MAASASSPDKVCDTLPAPVPALLPKDSTALSDTTEPVVEVDAEFPGGQDAWRAFLSNELDPDLPVRKGAPVGEYLTTAQFKVDKEGKVTSIRALTYNGYGMEEELVRVLEKAPTWTPATRNGVAVTAYRKQSITFYVEEVKGRSKKAKKRS